MAEVVVFWPRIDDRHLLSAVRFECQRSSPVVGSITHLHRSCEKGGLRRAREFSINWFQDEPESPTAQFASSPASTTSRAARPWVAQIRRMADFQIWSKSVAHWGSPFGLPHAVAAVGNSPPMYHRRALVPLRIAGVLGICPLLTLGPSRTPSPSPSPLWSRRVPSGSHDHCGPVLSVLNDGRGSKKMFFFFLSFSM